ncbi:hypothetical protein UFOVP449_102 [uncultured Caudovirales phage]|uniref:Uncharacterized protein n=1 Tax=uncultured Caudovirales phage TaxID=2100421 RepID=A0A6J5M8K1_9CAUD|nr:hypothetical protein UFOVP449_102 [uncultured Caudovirales phage]
MNKAELKELIKQVIAEETEYQKFFRKMLDKAGKDINSMSDEEKKRFFNAVDKAYKAKSEGKIVSSKKKNLDEDIFTGLLTTLGMFLMGKIVFYLIATTIEKGIKIFSKKVSKKTLINILDALMNNDNFIADISKIIDTKTGIDKSTADKIVNMPAVQSAIKSNIAATENKKSVEEELKSTFLRIWQDKSIMNSAISKVKNDIKK